MNTSTKPQTGAGLFYSSALKQDGQKLRRRPAEEFLPTLVTKGRLSCRVSRFSAGKTTVGKHTESVRVTAPDLTGNNTPQI